jgi:hypothetical protein
METLNLSISYTVSREINAAGILLEKYPVCLGTFANNEINCQVWEAGRAMSAAPKYFPPAEIGPTNIRNTRVSFARLAWLGKKNAMIAVTASKSKKNTNIQSQTSGVGGYAACAGASSTSLEFIGNLTFTANPL